MGNVESSGARATLSVEDQAKLHKDTIKKGIRELDREKRQMERTEQKSIMDMKKLAKQGNNPSAVKTMAKDLVRCRQAQTKFMEMKAQLNSTLIQIQTMKSQEQMARSMRGVTQCMTQMNKQMDPKYVTKVMNDFMIEQEKQKMTEEVMTEAIDDAMGNNDEEEDEVVNRVMEELGIQATAGMEAGAASTAVPAAKAQAQAAATEEEDFESRLKALQR